MPSVRGARVAVIGLGVGTAACYARPDETWDLFEINPAVVRMATDPRLFSFLRRCAPAAKIIVGDGRRALQLMADARYDLIMLDAFSSDAVPVHLLTREAFALYMRRLKHGGVLAVHISSRFLDLAPVIAANAEILGAFALLRDDKTDDPVRHSQSRWVALAADSTRLAQLANVPGWSALSGERGFRPWTDDYTSLLSVVRAFR
jgi:spermidine synthase